MSRRLGLALPLCVISMPHSSVPIRCLILCYSRGALYQCGIAVTAFCRQNCRPATPFLQNSVAVLKTNVKEMVVPLFNENVCANATCQMFGEFLKSSQQILDTFHNAIVLTGQLTKLFPTLVEYTRSQLARKLSGVSRYLVAILGGGAVQYTPILSTAPM